MSEFIDSVCLVTQGPDGSVNRGTGFVIYQDQGITYVATCAHVVNTGSKESIQVNGQSADVEAIGKGREDVAVLKVIGLTEKIPLKISQISEVGRRIKIPGISLSRSSSTDVVLRPLNGVLGEAISHMSNSGTKLVDAWDLVIDEQDYKIKEGYSGSPVIDVETDRVVAIVSHKVGEGGKGIAIAILSVVQVWKEIPESLLNSLSQSQILQTDSILLRPIDMIKQDPFRDDKIRILEKRLKTAKRQEEYISEEIAATGFELATVRGEVDRLRVKRLKRKLEEDLRQVSVELAELLKQRSLI